MRKLILVSILTLMLAGNALAADKPAGHFSVQPTVYSTDGYGFQKAGVSESSISGVRRPDGRVIWNVGQVIDLLGLSENTLKFHAKSQDRGCYYSIVNEAGQEFTFTTRKVYRVLEDETWLDLYTNSEVGAAFVEEGAYLPSEMLNAIFLTACATDEGVCLLDSADTNIPFVPELFGLHEYAVPVWYTTDKKAWFQCMENQTETPIVGVQGTNGLTYWPVRDIIDVSGIVPTAFGLTRSRAFEEYEATEGSVYSTFQLDFGHAQFEIYGHDILVRSPGNKNAKFKSLYQGDVEELGVIMDEDILYLSTEAIHTIFPNVYITEGELRILDDSVLPNCKNMEPNEKRRVTDAMWQLFNRDSEHYEMAKESIKAFKGKTLWFQKDVAAYVWFFRPTVHINHEILGEDGYNSKDLASVIVHELTHIRERTNNETRSVVEQTKAMLALGMREDRVRDFLSFLSTQKNYKNGVKEAVLLLPNIQEE